METIEAKLSDFRKIDEAIREQYDGSHIWTQFWLSQFDSILDEVKKRIESMKDGKMPLYDPTIYRQKFWKDLIQNTQKSIFTTNINSTTLGRNAFGFGRRENRQLLLLQSEAHKRGVKIQRVFVYNPKDKLEVNMLPNIMSKQIGIGIEVFAIPLSRFNKTKAEIAFRNSDFKMDDFMIIDECLLYETSYDEENDTFANQLFFPFKDHVETGIRGLFESAEHFRDSLVNEKADRVTLENISSFPDL